jgi:hypothetical protein
MQRDQLNEKQLPRFVHLWYTTEKSQDISEVSILTIGQIQKLLSAELHEPASLLERTDTDLGDFDFGAVSTFVSCYDINVVKRLVQRFRIAPFVLTGQ